MTVSRLRRTGRPLFHVRYSDSIPDALTGEVAVFTRASSATFGDSNGWAGTAPVAFPRFHVSGGIPALLLQHSADAGAVETLYHDWLAPPSVPFAALVTFIVPPSADSQHGFVVGSLAGAHVLVRLSGTELRADHDNGTSTVTTSTSGLSAGEGDIVDALVRYRADGSLGLEGARNGGTPVVASDTAAHTPAASWGQPRIWTAHPADSVAKTCLVREIRAHPDPTVTLAFLADGPRDAVPSTDLPGGLGFLQSPAGYWSLETVGSPRMTFSEHVDGYLVLDTPLGDPGGKTLSLAAGYLEITP